jgi:hypothetical protein
MVFSLEALAALHGDCLLLHFGRTSEPRTVLIDGGPSPVYGATLKPRLLELRASLIALGCIEVDDPLPLAIAMVSHIDDDHIGGLLALAEDPDGGLGLTCPSWVEPKTLWHNTFDELTGDPGPVLDLALLDEPASKTAAVIASVPQGRDLRKAAESLGWRINWPFPDGLVHRTDDGVRAIKLDDQTRLLILAPRHEEIARMRDEWSRQLARLKQGKTHSAAVAAYVDRSPTNLSSIVCLVQQQERKMLLTGDARGDLILQALDSAGVTVQGKLHVDILKIPHHGSMRDLDVAFFARITADHYVISGDGRYGNPETQTLEMIADSRPTDDFAIHITYAAGRCDLRERLARFVADRDGAGRSFEVTTRSDSALSLGIDLGDRPFQREESQR